MDRKTNQKWTVSVEDDVGRRIILGQLDYGLEWTRLNRVELRVSSMKRVTAIVTDVTLSLISIIIASTHLVLYNTGVKWG